MLVGNPEPFLAGLSRLGPLREEYGLYADFYRDELVQFSFGNRYTGREILHNNPPAPKRFEFVIERGPHLSYSVGPTGAIAVILYPPQSKLAAATEDLIFLGIGRFSGMQLKDRLRRDMKALIAYTYVTSVDGSPTFGERIKVWWLQTAYPHGKEGEFRLGKLRPGAVGMSVVKTVASATFVALIRPAATIIVVALALKLMPDLHNALPNGLFK
jgi:hypothetical protein